MLRTQAVLTAGACRVELVPHWMVFLLHASLPGIRGLCLGFEDSFGCLQAFGYTCSLSTFI